MTGPPAPVRSPAAVAFAKLPRLKPGPAKLGEDSRPRRRNMPKDRFRWKRLAELEPGALSADPHDLRGYSKLLAAKQDLRAFDGEILPLDQCAVGGKVAKLHRMGGARRFERRSHQHLASPLPPPPKIVALVHTPSHRQAS